ncbi:MAG TPA: histidine kinase [Trebonia sp.]|nr:histidine kinase [Trebonia sp.]
MSTDRAAQRGAGRGWRWLPWQAAESQWLVIVALVAVGAVMDTRVAGPGIVQNGHLVQLLACVPVVLLRRWPLPVLGVVTAATGLVTAAGSASLAYGILLGLALYISALRLPRRKSVPLALAVAAVLGATLVYSAFTAIHPQVPTSAVEDLVPLAGAWFIADSVAARRRYQAGLAAQARREQAAQVREERVRIAREMHDVVAHALAVITVQAGVGRCLAGQRPQQATAALESIETISRTAQDELRVMLGLLRDEGATTAPLAPTPRLADVRDLADTVRASGIQVELRMSGAERLLSPSLELSVYRVMQEALTNVVKHAPGARVVAELAVSAGKVRLDVRDDGGPDREKAPAAGLGTGHGIVGMRERIGAFGGWLVAGPIAGGGFQVTAEVPVEGVTD